MLNYLLESSFCWLVLYVFYALLLQREKTFGYNRIYLLLSLFLGVLTPLLKFDNQVTTVLLAPINLSVLITPTLDNLTQATPSFGQEILLILYGFGVVFFAGRFLQELLKIHAIYKKGTVKKCGNYYLVVMEDIYPPFSFAHCLFIPDTLTQDPKTYDCILTHETTHIHQAHSFDILLIEVLQIIFWFNPILILYKIALRDQHEYLADQAVLCKTTVTHYGHLLLEQSVSSTLPLVNFFFHSSLKKRIMMMTTNSKCFPLSNYLFSLLACVLTFWMISCQKNIKTSKEESPDSFPYLASCQNTDKAAQKKCSNQTLLTYVYNHLQYPEAARKAGIEGMVVLDFVIEKDGNIGAMKIAKSAKNDALDAEALRALQQIKEKGNIWKPGRKNGKDVAVNFKLPLSFKLK